MRERRIESESDLRERAIGAIRTEVAAGARDELRCAEPGRPHVHRHLDHHAHRGAFEAAGREPGRQHHPFRSEEHTSELQSRSDLVCRLLLEKKKRKRTTLLIPPVSTTQSSTNPTPIPTTRTATKASSVASATDTSARASATGPVQQPSHTQT